MITFTGLPYPPSVNMAYSSTFVKGKSRRFASRDLYKFKLAFDQFYLRHKRDIDKAGALCKSWFEQGFMFDLNILLLLPRIKIWTISEPVRLKRCDASNYIKCLEDCISNALGFDDKAIFRVTIEKTVANVDEPAVEVTVKPFKSTEYKTVVEEKILFTGVN